MNAKAQGRRQLKTTTIMIERIEFHGYIIEKETDPWPLKFGLNYRWFKEDDEHVHFSKTIAEAKEEIMDTILSGPPRHTVTLKGRAPYKFYSFIDALEFAIMFNAEDYQLEY